MDWRSGVSWSPENAKRRMTSIPFVGRGVCLVLCRGYISRSTDGTRAEGGDVRGRVGAGGSFGRSVA